MVGVIRRVYDYLSETEVEINERNYRSCYSFLRGIGIPDNDIPTYINAPELLLDPQHHPWPYHVANSRYNNLRECLQRDRERTGAGKSRIRRVLEYDLGKVLFRK